MVKKYDIAIIGAGASGLMAAGVALGRHKSVAVLDMGNRPARKVMVSGGGNCNITNTNANYTRYFGKNNDFVRSALKQFSPFDILDWTTQHNIKTYEKTPGQYFCTDGAAVVVNALSKDATDADFFWGTSVIDVTHNNGEFQIITNTQNIAATSVIVATGGISFATLGVSDIGYKIAKKFGHKIIPVRPGLCALAITGANSEFSGISLDGEITIGKNKIRDSLLLTHFGIGGPLAYRASLYDLDDGIKIKLIPQIDIYKILIDTKRTDGRKKLTTLLSEYLPARIVKYFINADTRNIADIKDTDLHAIANRIQNIYISGDKIKRHTLASAEVVRGGVSTDDVSSKTMESKLCRGLFFAGEVMDVTGDLGGFNLQWAWSSGFVAGNNA